MIIISIDKICGEILMKIFDIVNLQKVNPNDMSENLSYLIIPKKKLELLSFYHIYVKSVT